MNELLPLPVIPIMAMYISSGLLYHSESATQSFRGALLSKNGYLLEARIIYHVAVAISAHWPAGKLSCCHLRNWGEPVRGEKSLYCSSWKYISSALLCLKLTFTA